jgi:hypothetical protein
MHASDLRGLSGLPGPAEGMGCSQGVREYAGRVQTSSSAAVSADAPAPARQAWGRSPRRACCPRTAPPAGLRAPGREATRPATRPPPAPLPGTLSSLNLRASRRPARRCRSAATRAPRAPSALAARAPTRARRPSRPSQARRRRGQAPARSRPLPARAAHCGRRPLAGAGGTAAGRARARARLRRGCGAAASSGPRCALCERRGRCAGPDAEVVAAQAGEAVCAQVRTSHIDVSRAGLAAAGLQNQNPNPNPGGAAHERVRSLIDSGAAYRNQAAAGGALAPAATLTSTPALAAAGPAKADARCTVVHNGSNGTGAPKPAAAPHGSDAAGVAGQASAWAGARAGAEQRASGAAWGVPGVAHGGIGVGNPYGPSAGWMAGELARRSFAYSPSDAGRRRACQALLERMMVAACPPRLPAQRRCPGTPRPHVVTKRGMDSAYRIPRVSA